MDYTDNQSTLSTTKVYKQTGEGVKQNSAHRKIFLY